MDKYTAANQAARAELQTYLAGLTETELSRSMPAGWTIAALLGHLAFWDQRALTLIQKWQQKGVSFSAIDTDVVNEATRSGCLAIPPRAAVELVLAAAAAVDQAIAALSTELIDEIETNGKNVLLNRDKHRRTHLAEFAQVVGK